MTIDSVTLPSTSGPGYESLQIAVLDSDRVFTMTVGAGVTVHACDPSCDFVEIYVDDAAGDDGILIANTAAPTDGQYRILRPGTHYYGTLNGRKTLRIKARGADTLIQIMEVV